MKRVKIDLMQLYKNPEAVVEAFSPSHDMRLTTRDWSITSFAPTEYCITNIEASSGGVVLYADEVAILLRRVVELIIRGRYAAMLTVLAEYADNYNIDRLIAE